MSHDKLDLTKLLEYLKNNNSSSIDSTINEAYKTLPPEDQIKLVNLLESIKSNPQISHYVKNNFHKLKTNNFDPSLAIKDIDWSNYYYMIDLIITINIYSYS